MNTWKPIHRQLNARPSLTCWMEGGFRQALLQDCGGQSGLGIEAHLNSNQVWNSTGRERRVVRLYLPAYLQFSQTGSHSPHTVEHSLLLGGWLGDGALGAHNFHRMLLFAHLAVLALVELWFGSSVFPQDL